MIESSKKVKPWREAVKWASREAMHKTGQAMMLGPIRVALVFTMRKPASASKKKVTYPDRRPDIDKLCRSTLDGIVSAGVIEDDARIVILSAVKVFPGEGPMSLTAPGASIQIEELR